MLLIAGAALPARVSETGGGSSAGTSPARAMTLRYDPQFILEAVAQRLGVTLRPDIPVPTILVESTTPLGRVQEVAEAQWGFRPHVFVSTYAAAKNEIYLIDDAADYLPYNRTLDDALAHEFVHYLQAKYFKDDFKVEWSEAEAIAVQTWFREEYIYAGRAEAGTQFASTGR